MKLPQKLQCLWNYNREDGKGRFMTHPLPTCKVIIQKALVCPDVQASHHPWQLGRAHWPPRYSQNNRIGTSARSQVQLGKLSHFMGEEVEVQRGCQGLTMCLWWNQYSDSDPLAHSLASPFLSSWRNFWHKKTVSKHHCELVFKHKVRWQVWETRKEQNSGEMSFICLFFIVSHSFPLQGAPSLSQMWSTCSHDSNPVSVNAVLCQHFVRSWENMESGES